MLPPPPPPPIISWPSSLFCIFVIVTQTQHTPDAPPPPFSLQTQHTPDAPPPPSFLSLWGRHTKHAHTLFYPLVYLSLFHTHTHMHREHTVMHTHSSVLEPACLFCTENTYTVIRRTHSELSLWGRHTKHAHTLFYPLVYLSLFHTHTHMHREHTVVHTHSSVLVPACLFCTENTYTVIRRTHSDSLTRWRHIDTQNPLHTHTSTLITLSNIMWHTTPTQLNTFSLWKQKSACSRMVHDTYNIHKIYQKAVTVSSGKG